MDEILQEFVNSRGVDVRVDTAQGVIRGAKVLGLQSRNGRRYLPAALTQAAALYEGAKVNVNHPKGSPLAPRDYQDRLGSIRNVRVEAEGLFGDLHYNPKHHLAEQLAWDAMHAPENLGFSHNVEARTSRGNDGMVVEAILKVRSVDLVADPATTRGLYESAAIAPADPGTPWAELTLDDLRAARPDLVALVEGESAADARVLRTELEELKAREAGRERRLLAARLLEEFHLPDPSSGDPLARRLVGPRFLEALWAAPDESAMRQLVRERSEVVAAARQWDAPGQTLQRPISREQRTTSLAVVSDARSFARSIT